MNVITYAIGQEIHHHLAVQQVKMVKGKRKNQTMDNQMTDKIKDKMKKDKMIIKTKMIKMVVINLQKVALDQDLVQALVLVQVQVVDLVKNQMKVKEERNLKNHLMDKKVDMKVVKKNNQQKVNQESSRQKDKNQVIKDHLNNHQNHNNLVDQNQDKAKNHLHQQVIDQVADQNKLMTHDGNKSLTRFIRSKVIKHQNLKLFTSKHIQADN